MATEQKRKIVTPHPVQAAIHVAVAKLAGFRPHTIVGMADVHDARGLVDDLLALASIIDPVVTAVGRYAESSLGSFGKSFKEDFEDQLLKALQGNATYLIQDAGEAIAESREDAGAEMAREFQMGV